jgi:hypothetical protein
MPELSLAYHITQDDFVAAQHAHQRRNRWGKVQYGLGMALFGWFLLLAVFSLIFTPQVWLNYTLPMLLAGAYLYIYYFAHRIAYRKNAGLFSKVAVDIDDEGIHVVTEHSESTVPWPRYQHWVESDKVFLLYIGERTFNIIPKRILSDGEQEKLRKLLMNKVAVTVAA